MNRCFSILTFFFFSAAVTVFTSCRTITPSQFIDAEDEPGQLLFATPVQDVPVEQTQVEVPAPESTDVPEESPNLLKTNQIEVTKTLIKAASVGDETLYRIEIHALEDVDSVRVTESIPKSLAFKSATKGASFSGNDVIWTFPSMKRGQKKSIDVVVVPKSEGAHQVCSTVSVERSICMDLFSGQPKLAIEKQGPASVELGSVATWQVTITNNGSAAAKNVVVIDELPNAFEPVDQMRQTLEVLESGETTTIEYSGKAVTQGNFDNKAFATYEGDLNDAVEANSPIKVVRSGIRIRKSGPKEAYVFKPETFSITIENTGDTDLKNVRITDILPEGSSVIDSGLGRVSGNAIGWLIPNLPVGASQLITTEITATRKGESTNTVRVVTGNGFQSSDSAKTNWLAVPGVTVSIADSKDPIRVKERTTYNIQVNNQGKFEPVSGAVTVVFNDFIKPIAITGGEEGTIKGQTVTFPQTSLEPGKDIYMNIIAEGVKVGPGRVAMEFSADFLNDPIISQETTNVY